MTKTKPAFLLLFIFLMGNAGFVFAQSVVLPQIINPNTTPIPYCSDSVAVSRDISIQNTEINDANEGMKISIANYKKHEDVLVWHKVNVFKYEWNESQGFLVIKGPGTNEQYEEAVRNVYYKNIASIPDLEERSFSISLLDADYLPKTKHFYRFVSKLDITWKAAAAAADTMRYYGLKGYLATITSKEENDFIWTKIYGVGWIGANDEDTEGKWIWATGPEKGTHFWTGTTYSGYPIAGRYSNWSEDEPNNAHGETNGGVGEDYAHINQNPDKTPKTWNDLRNTGDGPTSMYYRPKGFIVEFGGMPGEPELNLSASSSIIVQKIAFAEEKDYEICEGDNKILNVDADPAYIYTWSPDKDISSINVSNPKVNPKLTTTYKAIGKLGGCADSAYFNVNVNARPLSKLSPDTIVCEGESIVLDPGEHLSYLWGTGDTSQTIVVAQEGLYDVTLINEAGCTTKTATVVENGIKPILDSSGFEALVCGSKIQTLNIAFVNGEASTKLRAMNSSKATVTNETTATPIITVSEFGKYQFELLINDENDCQYLDTLDIEFHNQPEAIILMDEEECKGYNLQLDFGGETIEEALFSWYYNDNVFLSEPDLFKVEIPLGFGIPGRSVGLMINEQGCVTDTTIPVIVTPNIEIVSNKNEGCTPLLVQFDARSTETVQSYSWDFNDGASPDYKDPVHEFVNQGTTDLFFDVGLEVVSDEGCRNSGVMDSLVVVHPIPTVDLSFNENDCNPVQMEIRYEGSGNEADTFYWDLSDLKPEEILINPGTTKGALEIKRSSEPTAELGIQVVSEFGCTSDTILKTWKRKPVFEVIVDTTEGCPPLTVSASTIVLDSVDKINFNFDLGEGTIGPGDKVEHTYTTVNTRNQIQFTGTSTITGCSETVVYDDTVYVYPVPQAGFSPVPEVVLISNPEIVFDNLSIDASYYEWDFGDMSAISTEYSPMHRYSEMGFFFVYLSAYNNLGCFDTTSNRVAVAFDKLFPPNAFSPNATMEEDREFRIYSEGVTDEGYQLLIFNRWGEVIFESNSQENGWDGKMKNSNYAPSGVYPWVLQYNDFRGERHKQRGVVTLIF